MVKQELKASDNGHVPKTCSSYVMGVFMQFSVDLYTFIIMPVLILCSNEEIQERTSKVYIIYCLWLLSEYITWSPLKNRRPKNFTIGHFGHPVSNSRV